MTNDEAELRSLMTKFYFPAQSSEWRMTNDEWRMMNDEFWNKMSKKSYFSKKLDIFLDIFVVDISELDMEVIGH